MAAPVPAMAEAGQTSAADAAAEWDALSREDDSQETPVVDSPSISADWPADGQGLPQDSENDGKTCPTPRPATRNACRGSAGW